MTANVETAIVTAVTAPRPILENDRIDEGR
jgi:hypothetical protein